VSESNKPVLFPISLAQPDVSVAVTVISIVTGRRPLAGLVSGCMDLLDFPDSGCPCGYSSVQLFLVVQSLLTHD
jgi:hypothetical protein